MDNFKRYLVIKGNNNSFEKYYIDQLNNSGIFTVPYYSSDSFLRKTFTHFGLPCDYLWYGNWKTKIDEFQTIIVFDSLHTDKLLKYIRKKSSARLIYWHWNPMRKNNDQKIWKATRNYVEHWTFNPSDATKYKMRLNNQFFFFQNSMDNKKEKKVYFVGTDKGRYSKLVKVSNIVKKINYYPDFHVIDTNKNGEFYQKNFIEYGNVLSSINKAYAVLELTQKGQEGLTSRSLEAMFLGTKLLTDNINILEYPFYRKENIFVIGKDPIEKLDYFLAIPFVEINKRDLYPYSSQGWIKGFGR